MHRLGVFFAILLLFGCGIGESVDSAVSHFEKHRLSFEKMRDILDAYPAIRVVQPLYDPGNARDVGKDERLRGLSEPEIIAYREVKSIMKSVRITLINVNRLDPDAPLIYFRLYDYGIAGDSESIGIVWIPTENSKKYTDGYVCKPTSKLGWYVCET